jgi:methyl-accepting chemotaxis protein
MIIKDVNLVALQLSASGEQLTASAAQSSTASEQVAVSMQEVSEGGTSQLRQVSHTELNLQEMNLIVLGITDKANKVLQDADLAAQRTHDGSATIQETLHQMDAMQSKIQVLSADIDSLVQTSEQIEQIIGMITDISTQTNLLALNASIEAARAGQSGKGFAVVAGEVKKLAAQSQESAQHISELVGAIRNGMRTTKATMLDVTHEVNNSIQGVGSASRLIGELRNTADNVATQMAQISLSTSEIGNRADTVSISLGHVKKVSEESSEKIVLTAAATEEQLAAMEQIAAASEELSKMAESLQKLIERFKI